MDRYLAPFARHVDLASGHVDDPVSVTRRTLADMRGFYADADAEAALAEANPLIYRVFEASDTPAEEGQLRYSTTVIESGLVGEEYFMTKGHYHAKRDRAELYVGLRGHGLLLMQTPEGAVDAKEMHPGTAAYVPPYWGHRTINTGREPFAFLAAYPADAGYDYDTIASDGFARLVVRRGEGYALVPPA
ncbi:MAG: glucose-6-phosphate isomerase family protein [Jiangellaceae bacterium]